MPANQKTWEKITRAELDVLKSNLRSKGLVPPVERQVHDPRSRCGRRLRVHRDVNPEVTIKETPPFVSYNYVFGLLDEEIKKVDR